MEEEAGVGGRSEHELSTLNFRWDVLENVAASARCFAADVAVIFGKKEAGGWLSFKN